MIKYPLEGTVDRAIDAGLNILVSKGLQTLTWAELMNFLGIVDKLGIKEDSHKSILDFRGGILDEIKRREKIYRSRLGLDELMQLFTEVSAGPCSISPQAAHPHPLQTCPKTRLSESQS
jgi:hypothetical protein